MAHEETLNELHTILHDTRLEHEDRDDLYTILSQTSEEECTRIVELFKKKPDWIYKMMDNLTAKRAALGIGSHDLWKEILEQEEKELLILSTK